MTLPLATSAPADIPLAPQAKTLGHVISVRGSQASVGIPTASAQTPEDARATVGKFLGVRAGKSLIVGLIADVSLGEAVAMATRNPARVGGIAGRKRGLETGDRADLVRFVVEESRVRVLETFVSGRRVYNSAG